MYDEAAKVEVVERERAGLGSSITQPVQATIRNCYTGDLAHNNLGPSRSPQGPPELTSSIQHDTLSLHTCPQSKEKGGTTQDIGPAPKDNDKEETVILVSILISRIRLSKIARRTTVHEKTHAELSSCSGRIVYYLLAKDR